MAAGDGDGDTDTRLAVSLKESLSPEAPASLASFTLCMWYYATAFLDASTLLSYATSKMDNAIRLSKHNAIYSVDVFFFMIDFTFSYKLSFLLNKPLR